MANDNGRLTLEDLRLGSRFTTRYTRQRGKLVGRGPMAAMVCWHKTRRRVLFGRRTRTEHYYSEPEVIANGTEVEKGWSW